MPRYRSIGEHLRKLRCSKGIRSASELGRRAKLSAGHIAMFERGEVRPRWGTAKKLADALQLTDEERGEFFRIIDAAGKPKDIREVMASPLPPEAAIWKHLPGLLLNVPHMPPAEFCSDIDAMVSESVRASGSMLARIALDMTPPTAQARSDLREELLGRLPGPFDHLTPGMAAILIPRLWKARIFRSPESTAGLVKHIAEWSFSPGSEWSSRTGITIQLVDAALRSRWGVHHVEPNEVARLHDAMTVQWLYDQIGLTDLFGPVQKNPFLRRSSLGKDLQNLAGLDREAVRKLVAEWETGPDVDEWCTTACGLFDVIDRSVFTVRIFDEPDLLRMLLGQDFPYGRDEVLKKAEDLRSLLGEDLRERLLRAAG